MSSKLKSVTKFQKTPSWIGLGKRKEKHNTKQKQKKEKREQWLPFIQNPPARRQSAPIETSPLCGVHRTRLLRWTEMQIPLFPLIQIFKFSNIYAATIEWQLTSLIFIEEMRKPWAAVNLASSGPRSPGRGGGRGNNPFIQTFGLKE